jgi:hypothetical protein
MTDSEDIPTEAPHVFIRGEGGSVFKLDLPLHESITERLLKGYLVRVANADGDPYVEDEVPNLEIAEAALEDGDPADVTPAVIEAAGLPTVRPELSALKAEWVGWAVAESARRGHPITPDDAEALTKHDLIEAYGTDPIVPAEEPSINPATEAAATAEN